MDHRRRLEKLEIAAASIGVSLRELCRDADMASNNIYRWRRGSVDPQLGLFGRVMTALESALQRRQTRIFFTLAPHYLSPDELAAAARRHGFDLATLDHPPEGGRGSPGAGPSRATNPAREDCSPVPGTAAAAGGGR